MKKYLFFLIAFILLGKATQAQDYRGSLGFRISGFNSNGLTGKLFILPDKAIEGILAARWRGMHIAGLYEIHAPAFNVTGLTWYYGPGMHIATWKDTSKNPWWDDDVNHTVIGVDGIIGIEYTFGEIPFNLSLDFKPAFHIIGHFGFWYDELAVSIRYVF